MTNLAVDIRKNEVSEEIGVVTAVAKGSVSVRVGARSFAAARAKSCLVAPEVEDLVLVAVASSGDAWVLAVLEGKAKETSVKIDGDLSLKVDGRVAVSAPQGIGMVSGKDFSVVSAKVEVNAVEGGVVLDRLTFFGRVVHSEMERVRTVAASIDRTVDRVVERVKRCYRTVDEIDRVDAQQVDYRARQVMSLRSENTVMTAEKLVKVDGAQIHVG